MNEIRSELNGVRGLALDGERCTAFATLLPTGRRSSTKRRAGSYHIVEGDRILVFMFRNLDIWALHYNQIKHFAESICPLLSIKGEMSGAFCGPVILHFPLEDGKSFALRNYWPLSLSQWTVCRNSSHTCYTVLLPKYFKIQYLARKQYIPKKCGVYLPEDTTTKSSRSQAKDGPS